MGVTQGEALLRMGVAIVLAAPIGFERERSGHSAGLRTHILLGLASALLMLVSTQFALLQGYEKGGVITVDAARIAGGAIQGLGLLCGGAILRMGMNVRGLTTAASMWSVSALGLCAGGGMFVEACAGCALSLVVLVPLASVEGRLWQLFHRRIIVVLTEERSDREADSKKRVAAALRAGGGTVLEVDYEHDFETGAVTVDMKVRFPGEEALVRALRELESISGIRKVYIQRPD